MTEKYLNFWWVNIKGNISNSILSELVSWRYMVLQFLSRIVHLSRHRLPQLFQWFHIFLIARQIDYYFLMNVRNLDFCIVNRNSKIIIYQRNQIHIKVNGYFEGVKWILDLFNWGPERNWNGLKSDKIYLIRLGIFSLRTSLYDLSGLEIRNHKSVFCDRTRSTWPSFQDFKIVISRLGQPKIWILLSI